MPERNPLGSLAPYYNNAYIYWDIGSQQTDEAKSGLELNKQVIPMPHLVRRSGYLEAH
jgi:hypothetical protein